MRTGEVRLDGWDDIAAYLQRSKSWCKDWNKRHQDSERIPVFKLGKGITSKWCAWPSDLDAWVKARVPQRPPRSGPYR